jgi:hypothetical protein
MSKALKTDKFRKTIDHHEVINDETLQTEKTEITLSFCDQQSLHQVEVEFIMTDKTRTGPWGFFTTKPLTLRQQILRDLLTTVYLTTKPLTFW